MQLSLKGGFAQTRIAPNGMLSVTVPPSFVNFSNGFNINKFIFDMLGISDSQPNPDHFEYHVICKDKHVWYVDGGLF